MAPLLQLFMVIAVSILIANFYLRYQRLKEVPGPFLASFTDVWRAYVHNFCSLSTTLLQLHEKYGPLVRIGPNSVSVSDPAAVRVIYSNHGLFKKADSYSTLRVLAEGKVVGSIIDMQDEDKNTALKRGVGGAFAVKNILDYERDLDRTVDGLTQRILENPTFDLFEVLRFFQLDFLTKIAFSENLGHLRTGQDVWGITGSSRDRIAHWARWQPLPILERLTFQQPLWSRFTNQSSKWAQVALEKLHARESREGVPEKKDLLQKYIDASEKHPDTMKHDAISAMVTSTISAGFDSTSVTMTSVIYYLITHPDVHIKLMRELEQGIECGPLFCKPQYSEVNKLPYLDAVFKEATRCNPFLTVPLERVVPPEGAKISGTWIPGGTVVGCLATVIHQNRDCFGQDADKFRPERWLTEDPKAKIAMERASLGFGSGKRICLGRHIAELEIKKLIPTLLLKFKMSIRDPHATLDYEDGVTAFPKPILVNFEETMRADLSYSTLKDQE